MPRSPNEQQFLTHWLIVLIVTVPCSLLVAGVAAAATWVGFEGTLSPTGRFLATTGAGLSAFVITVIELTKQLDRLLRQKPE